MSAAMMTNNNILLSDPPLPAHVTITLVMIERLRRELRYVRIVDVDDPRVLALDEARFFLHDYVAGRASIAQFARVLEYAAGGVKVLT